MVSLPSSRDRLGLAHKTLGHHQHLSAPVAPTLPPHTHLHVPSSVITSRSVPLMSNTRQWNAPFPPITCMGPPPSSSSQCRPHLYWTGPIPDHHSRRTIAMALTNHDWPLIFRLLWILALTLHPDSMIATNSPHPARGSQILCIIIMWKVYLPFLGYPTELFTIRAGRSEAA